MKKIFLWLLLVLAAATFWSCSDDSSTEPAPNTPTATLTISSNSLTFGNVENSSVSAEQSFTVSGSNLTSSVTVKASNGFKVSVTTGSGFADSVVINSTNGTLAASTVYARFQPTAAQTYNGSIVVKATGVNKVISVTGTCPVGLEMNYAGYGTPEANGYRITSETFYEGKDEQGNWKLFRKWEFVYQNNQIVKIMETDNNNTVREVPVTYQYGKPAIVELTPSYCAKNFEYYPNGRIKKDKWSSSSYSEYFYENDKLAQKKNYNNNVVSSTESYSYTSVGKLSQINSKSDVYISSKTYTYSGARLISLIHHDEAISNGYINNDTIRYFYNTSNYCIETKSIEEYCPAIYGYDTSNRLVLSDLGARKDYVSYDSNGNVQTQLFDYLSPSNLDRYIVYTFEQAVGNFNDFFPKKFSKTMPVGAIDHITSW